jgi:hypothetical protein
VVPEFDDLARRAIGAQARAEDLVAAARQRNAVAQTLCDASAGSTMLLRCAWCGSIQVNELWLELTAITRSQQWIVRAVRDRATHGICATCLEAVTRSADDQRAAAAHAVLH